MHSLSSSIRQALTDFDEVEVSRRLGGLKKKETTGFLVAPLGTDWRFTHDVIFSSFHPLHSDTDFGTDLLPNLSMYNHIHKGSERETHKGWLPRGFYVQMTLPSPCMRELVNHNADFVPVAPVKKGGKEGGREGGRAPSGF
ncbi:hypothetical protein VYU27_007873 [Nannochloropsis oceanica]